MLDQPWWQGPLQIANGLATIVIAIATIVYVRYAAKQWTAIRDQARIAQDTLVANKRAFVSAVGISPFFYPDATTQLYSWRLSPQWQNSGDTPTKGLTIYTGCEIRTTPLPPGFSFVPPTAPGTGFLAPKVQLTGGAAPEHPRAAITPQDLADVQAGRKFIYLWGWAKYSDVFPGTPQHVTKFCWSITPVGNPHTFVPHTQGAPPTPGTLIFQYRHHTEGNCADDECK